MGDRNMKPSVDPVADVLLDFQSVMAQFLDLQAEMAGAFANRRQRVRVVQISTPPVAAPRVAETAAPPVSEPNTETVSAIAHHPAAPAGLSVPDVSPVEPLRVSRYTLATGERPAPAARADLAAGHAIVLTDDGRGIAGVVAERLRSLGRRVAIISTQHNSDGLDVFRSSLDTVEEVERVVGAIRESCGPTAALIHLMPLSTAPRLEAMDADLWWNRLSSETRTLFLLSKSLGSSLEEAARNGGAALLAATSMGGRFGTTAIESPVPSQGGIVGFTKCAAVEWPDVRVRVIDLDSTAPVEQLAAHVLDEIWTLDPTPEIGYAGGRRVGVEVVRSPASLDRSFVLPSDAVVLATGGARGITAEVCLELAERYQLTFVLVGQTPLPAPTEPPDVASLAVPADIKRALVGRLQAGGARVTPAMVEKAYRELVKEREIRETISRLSAAGARTHYVQLDVQDERAFGALIDEIYSTYGRLDGVIHGAGIIEDKLIRDKSLESFDRVFRTKTISSFVLSRRLRSESLRFMIFFSSVAGRFGNRGQADYAAGNEVISKLAVVLQHQWPGRICSIAWAPWDKLGMVSPELKREFARRGVELLAPAAGRRALWDEIQQRSSSPAEVVVGGSAATPLASGTGRESLPLLKNAARDLSQAGVIRFLRDLDPSVDLYLMDHRLDGRPVLPFAFATELMAEAAQAAFPNLHVAAVRDVQLFKGIVTESAPLPMTIAVRKEPRSTTNGLVEVDVDISTPSQSPSLRYRSVVQLTSRPLPPPMFDALPGSIAPLSKTLSAAYRDWTFHGPLFQRVSDISGVGPEAIQGTIVSPSTVRVLSTVQQTDWIIDPFVFDAALQLILIWSRSQHDKTALPSRIGAFRRYGQLSDERLACHVAVESLAGGHALKSDVHFVDANKRIIGLLEGAEASCTAALNRLTGLDARDRSVQ
jgi:NAD(P)-dependent dehydrogenase (short-subunit alcohol dehydrogenase family)